MSSYAPADRGSDLLYAVLQRHLASFLERAECDGVSIPAHAREELTDYLACGIVEHGFTLLRCKDCGTARAVPFSCKHRGFCPSCCGRRMNQTAANLVDRVFPRVPVRQWVLSLPLPLRFMLAWNGDLCRAVLGTFLDTVTEFYRETLDLPEGHGGAVTFEQLFGSSLNANLHFHSIVLDGLYTTDAGGPPVFVPAPPPTTADVQLVVSRIRARVERLLRARGLLDDDGELLEPDRPDREHEAQADLLAASVAGRHALGTRAGAVPRYLRSPSLRRLPPRCAADGWFNLHADVRVAPHDVDALERLCRYVARPPLSHDRLSLAADGRLHLRFKRPWDDGTSGLLLTPEQLIARLVAIIPQPRRNLVHYHGVLAPAARLRSLVVPTPHEAEHHEVPDLVRCVHLPRCSQRSWIPWSDLLWRVFGADALACPECGGRMAVHAVLHGVWATKRVLTSLGAPAHQPRLWPRGPPRTAA